MQTIDLSIEYIVDGSGRWANHEKTLVDVRIKYAEFDEEMECTLTPSDPEFPHIERAWNKVVNLGEIGDITTFDDSSLRAHQVAEIQEMDPNFAYDPTLQYGDDGFRSADDLAVLIADMLSSAD